jgi:SAM-dependent methyltransferase
LETRNSNGLGQFCSSLEEREGLSVLDLAGLNQQTVSFITNQGHRLYSDDFLLQLDQCFGKGNFYQDQTDPKLMDKFLKATLDFPDQSFDGALVWDVLEYLAPPLLSAVVSKLYRILRPGSCLLAVFHAEEREAVTAYSYRIFDQRNIQMAVRGERRPAQFFNNRSLERLFQDFDSVKFFLTRDHLREVIVRR